ncbi:isoleucine--tRNA ligase [Candidatus Gracilibacteria bacterium]|nr:isoleucine--tRNA ligase [Candidatus Gracilibacteria bacterium]
MFKEVNPKQSFPKLEKEIINFWKENDTFKKSISSREGGEIFNFYDGPPFATGTPHYGHILAGTIKDVIPRYQTMLGKKVDRKFGWDCHGLPIENIVEKKLQISGKDDIEKKIGVYDFNENCRANVFGYVDEWKKTVERMGRWVDMEDDYKTMDNGFMESVWWVFKTIYDKGLIYEGNKIVPYCPRCTTPLSNFEVNQGYKDKQSKTVTVKFKVKGSESKYILAWTTTPWTLYSNLGLAVGEDILYSEVLDNKTGETYILASEKIKDYYKVESDYKIVREYKGNCLVGIEYEPLFNDFVVQLKDLNLDFGTNIKLGQNSYKVVLGHHVSTETGTGIVHIAPAYGEDDFVIGEKEGLGFVAHIDDRGRTFNLLTNNDIFVFDFNDLVIEELKKLKLSVNISTINHSYPHCWRCDTPLIYRGISAWYVAVEKIRDKMIENNKKINWNPEEIKTGRFGKWVENARDWNISRNRYWGSAIPVWQSEDKKEEICIGSIKELYELNLDFGQIYKKEEKYFYTKTNKEIDLHKHFVDEILIKNPKTGNTLKRIPEVLDCWFESGAMPYASVHYPFENTDNFKFPGDFISEGLDQTRGWFYTLLILGTALFDNTPFLNCVVSGIILASDGKKMSKSLKNYTDPNILMDKYGADAMRFYLMNSPVVEAQDLRFSDAGVEEVIKKVILPLWNTYSFFTTYANIDNFTPNKGNIYYIRHGQTDNNKNGIVNGGDDDIDLNQTGIDETISLAKSLASSGIKFDVIISSPMKRTVHTANLIKNHLNYDVEIVENEAFREQLFGEFKGMSHEEIKQKYGCKTDRELTVVYRNNKLEGILDFSKKVIDGYKSLEEKYAGKNILIISHGGVFRPINQYLNDLTLEQAFYEVPGVKNSKLYKLPNYKKSNLLDKWIIGELNLLTGNVSNALDNYKLNHATRDIIKFMDNLTNWYVRRSRKRFWGEEMTKDKKEAYETLYEVLVEVSKIIAPYMPFISEKIYKELTKNESVHLELFSNKNPGFIFDDLIKNTSVVQEIIALGFQARANAKIRVRQPLKYIKITQKLDTYFEDIIKDELNVKEILNFKENEIPSQICKPNAKLIGPKFGQNVKFIISQAKQGNFKLLDNGNVLVGEFELLKEEFELEFVVNGELDNTLELIESSNGKIVSLSTEINDELLLEGYARDIVRHIQESRKEADYKVDDRIVVGLTSENPILKDILNKFGSYIEKETLSKIDTLDNFDLEKELEVEDLKISLRLKR